LQYISINQDGEMIYLKRTKIEQRYVRTDEETICNVGFLGRIYKNSVIKITFTKEIEEAESSNSKEDDRYNSENMIIELIR